MITVTFGSAHLQGNFSSFLYCKENNAKLIARKYIDRRSYAMDGKKKQKQEGNVVLFPNLGSRLVEKGMEHIEKREFKRAVELYSQARELDPENPDVNVGLIVSFVEIGRYIEARDLCKEMLHKGIGDYFQIVSIYLMVLLQLNEHEEMVTTIEALLDDNQVPTDKIDHFKKMLAFSSRILEENEDMSIEMVEEKQIELDFNDDEWFAGKTDEEIFRNISRFSNANIRAFMPSVQTFLLDEKAHPFLKTLLLHILKEQEYDKHVRVIKLSQEMVIIPTEILHLKDTNFFKTVTSLVEKHLEQENPSLLAMATSLIERQQFVMYPIEPEERTFPVWACAYHAVAESYQTGEDTVIERAALYEVSPDSVNEMILQIHTIEEFSYGNI